MKHVIRTGTSALAMLLAMPAAAQTAITPDTAAPASTGTTATQAGSVTVIDGGRRVGNNLFHSFSGFSLGTGDSAVWVRSANDGASIANIINRITGGRPSTIDGTITTAGMPNANFFFINPAGIVFGAGAEIAVPNVAHFSTAANLRFADGAVFGVTTPGGSVFSVAAPAAFGFLGSQGNITINGVGTDFVGSGTGLSLSAANITIRESEFYPGTLDMVALGNAARNVTLADPLAVRSGAGTITVDNSYVSVQPSAARNGLVRINAGTLDVISSVLASDSNDLSAAGLRVLAGDVVLRARPDGAQITYLGTFAPGDGDAADVDIDALRLLISGTSQIGSLARPEASGNAGDIRIRTGLLSLSESASIISSAYGESASGDIEITADTMLMTSGAQIETNTFGSGDGGDISIAVGSLAMNNAVIEAEAKEGATGAAGFIKINAGSISLNNSARISASNSGAGNSGFLDITANTMVMTSGAEIASNTFGSGNGGDMIVNVGSLTMDDAIIEAEARENATGMAGSVTLSAKTITLNNASRISSSNFGSGFGGLLDITADTITLRDASRIEADTLGAEGAGGLVFVRGKTIRLESGSEISSVTLGSGNAGIVSVEADSLVLDSGALLSSTFGSGQAGAVLVTVGSLELRNFGEITTSTYANGEAGQVGINARSITMSSRAAISSETFGSGPAGDIVITSLNGVRPDLTVTGGASITSGQNGALATGNAGSVQIEANRIVLGPSSRPAISTNVANAGLAGQIRIAASSLLVDGTQIASAATGTLEGEAGDIIIAADTINLVNGGKIESSSASPEAAGLIRLITDRLVVQGQGSQITSENLSRRGGAAGAIGVEANRIELLDGGAITTNSVAGAAGDITLLLPDNGVLLLRGAQSSGVITTSSGPGTGGIITISNPYLILSDGGQILALGQESGADVLIQSGFFIRSADRLNLLSVNGSLLLDSQVGDLSTGAEQVDLSFLDASSVLRGQCAGTRRGGTNQLNLRTFGPNAAAAVPAAPRGRPIVLDGRAGALACGR